jgi:hypothetical protein
MPRPCGDTPPAVFKVRQMKTTIPGFLGLLVVLAAGGPPQAATIRHAESFTFPDRSAPAVVGESKIRDWIDFDVPPFDPALGTLEAVRVGFSTSEMDLTLLVDNEAPYQQSNTRWTAKALFWAEAPNVSPYYVWSYRYQWAALGSDDDTQPDFVGEDSAVVTGPISGLDYDRPATDLAAYVNTGSVPVRLRKTVRSEPVSDVTATRIDHSGTTTGELWVSYQYTPIPEPATPALLGVGAVGLVACAWRKRRR